MPLSHRGKQQAMLIGERLRNNFDIHSLYTSPQKCTRQTAEWIGDVLRIVPEIEDDLRELESGDLATLSNEEVRKYYPGFLSGESLEEARVPGSETYADLHTRVANAVSQLVNKSPDQQIACITHARRRAQTPVRVPHSRHPSPSTQSRRRTHLHIPQRYCPPCRPPQIIHTSSARGPRVSIAIEIRSLRVPSPLQW